jgi:outer membrane protein assembly factor BamA
VGFTRDMNSGAADNGSLVGEARRYFTPVSQLVLATRVQGQMSYGNDAQRFYLGGPWSLPGYDPRTMAGLRTALVRQEARFPVLQGLTLAFPVAWQFPTVSAAAFADMAWAWDAGGFQPLSFTDEELSGIVQPDGMGVQGHLGSVGAGWFIGGGYFPAIRWNYAWTTADFRHFSRRPRTEFSIGFNF